MSTDPYLSYRFLVEVDSLIVAGFSEVTGLEMQLQTEDYQEGGVNTYTHKLPTRFEHPNLSLKRGITDSTVLWDWIQSVSLGLGILPTTQRLNVPTTQRLSVPTIQGPNVPTIQRRNVRILMLDAAGNESWGWECRDAYPVRWTGPEFRADQGAVATETLELAHRGLSRIGGLP